MMETRLSDGTQIAVQDNRKLYMGGLLPTKPFSGRLLLSPCIRETELLRHTVVISEMHSPYTVRRVVYAEICSFNYSVKPPRHAGTSVSVLGVATLSTTSHLLNYFRALEI